MAISGTIIQSDSGTVGVGGSSCTATFPGSTTAGNILVAIVAVRQGSLTGVTYPSGFSAAVQQGTPGDECYGGFAWKIASGSETSLTANFTGGTVTTANLTICEFSSADLDTSAVEASSEDETYVNAGAGNLTLTTGSATLTSSSGLAIGIGCTYNISNFDGGTPGSWSWSNSYAEQVWTDAAETGRAGVIVATKVLSSSGATSSTVTFPSDTGQSTYGGQLLFGVSATNDSDTPSGVAATATAGTAGASSVDGTTENNPFVSIKLF